MILRQGLCRYSKAILLTLLSQLTTRSNQMIKQAYRTVLAVSQRVPNKLLYGFTTIKKSSIQTSDHYMKIIV